LGHRLIRTAIIAAGVLAFPASLTATSPTASGAAIAASDHSCARTAESHAACWGDNSAGGLGTGTTTASSHAVDVVDLGTAVTAIATGDRYSCAVTTGGGVRCWGYNMFGQLGDGTKADRLTPVDVVGLAAGVGTISARGEHTCALVADNMRCWGANINGQLGNGTTISSSVPVDVVNLDEGVTSIAVGGEHSCAIVRTGSLRCWGWNKYAQVGNGATTDSTVPVDVGLGGEIAAVSAGGRHTCALTTSGEVSCWGYNMFGQLGDGTTTDRAVPVAVVGLSSGAAAITAGGNFTCALMRDGGVKCWGSNAGGQLGDGTTVDRHSPVAVDGLTSPATTVAAGYYHSCVIMSAGTAACWGGNDTGQLGNGSLNDIGQADAVRNADGSPLVIAGAGGKANQTWLAPAIAIAIVAGAVVIATVGWSSTKRRARR
jgi:alpha-tubulin suppressor-like RCC1 family protein